MKIILAANVENLGEIGDIKDVPVGFARNYLLPKGFAYLATKNEIKRVERMKAKYIEQRGMELQKAQATAERLKTMEVNIVRSVHEEKKLFGAVSAAEITAALEGKGIKIDKKRIVIKEPIKEVGIYEAQVKIHPEVIVPLKIWVTPEG